MTDDIKVPSWLSNRLADARKKVASLQDQLQQEDCEWRRERMKNWLRQAEENVNKLRHWTTLT